MQHQYDIRMATPEEIADPALEHFDHTKLSAVNTCPTWGILRYGMSKAMPGTGTAQALLAGSLLHECFSVVRAVQLWQVQGAEALATRRLAELFTVDRAAILTDIIRRGVDAGDTSAGCGRSAALACLETGNWVDDPYDTRRTYQAIETCLLYYTQRWDYERYPIAVWMDATGVPHVGIEQPFALRVDMLDMKPFLFTGMLDGLVWNGRRLTLEDNKTGARIDDVWASAFHTSHQMTGYMMAANLMTGTWCSDANIIGLQIPLPRNISDGLRWEPTKREAHQFTAWERWMAHTVKLYREHKNDVLNAPMYTHSCSRYFRSCSFIPFCCADDDEKQQILTEMRDDHWSPLHKE